MKILLIYVLGVALIATTSAWADDTHNAKKARPAGDDMLTPGNSKISLQEYEDQTVFKCDFPMKGNVEMSATCKSGDKTVTLNTDDLHDARYLSEEVQPTCVSFQDRRFDIKRDDGKKKISEALVAYMQKKLYDTVQKACTKKFKAEFGVEPAQITASWPTYTYKRQNGAVSESKRMSFFCQDTKPKTLNDDMLFKIFH